MRTRLRIVGFGRKFLLLLAAGVVSVFPLAAYGQANTQAMDEASIRSAISDLAGKSEPKARAAIKKLHATGKTAIPILIESIGDESGVRFSLVNPNSSILLPGSLENSLGKTSAYIIELILGRETLVFAPDQESPFMFGEPANYVYWHGIVVKSKNKAIKLTEFSSVKTEYENWWSKNKELTMIELRKAWSEGKKPLSESGYRWE